MALKKELLTRIAQLDDDEGIRKKVCYTVAELARNLMGMLTILLLQILHKKIVRFFSR